MMLTESQEFKIFYARCELKRLHDYALSDKTFESYSVGGANFGKREALFASIQYNVLKLVWVANDVENDPKMVLI